ncbi:nucleopolyhedrovirus P10 family protein [Streptomyces sp. NPDC055058]
MTAERWTRAVREQVGLGRFLPLGGPRDGAWIAERAAASVLRSAARAVDGVRLDALRIGLAAPEEAGEPVVPAPASALPPGALRVTAECAATAAEPLPVTADRLRAALAGAAAERLGLEVAEVDLRVTELLDGFETSPVSTSPSESSASSASVAADDVPADGDARRVALAVLAVAGVARLTGTPGRPVRLTVTPPGEAALSHRHVRVDLAVEAGHRALDVARAVRAAVRETLPDRPTVAVLVTDAD